VTYHLRHWHVNRPLKTGVSCIFHDYEKYNLIYLMKKIVVYSPDSNICLSLFMYLQSDYNVTTTTDVSILKTMVKHIKFDLLIMDAQPSKSVEAFCKGMKEHNPEIPVILTYVYQDNNKLFDLNIRKYISSVFYKPFDLYEVSKYLTSLLV